MSALGQTLTVLESRDPTLKGVSGEFVLETANMLVLKTGAGLLNLPKRGTVMASKSKGVLVGDEMVGRLEDRLRSFTP